MENKKWPKQLEKALTTIRHIGAVNSSQDQDELDDFPKVKDLKKGLHPNDFKLNEIKFFAGSEHCKEQCKNYESSVALSIQNNQGESSLFLPDYLNLMKDVSAPYKTIPLDFLYEKADHSGVKVIDF